MTSVDITGQLAGYMAQARDIRLALDVAQEAKHRILDTLAAMVSGSHLPAGEMAIHFARAQGGVAEASRRYCHRESRSRINNHQALTGYKPRARRERSKVDRLVLAARWTRGLNIHSCAARNAPSSNSEKGIRGQRRAKLHKQN